MTDPRAYWIWFQKMFGIGSRRAELFLGYFQHPGDIYREVKAGGRASGMLEQKELAAVDSAMEQAREMLRRALKKGCQVITPEDPAYPKGLQTIYSRPAVLYCKGDLTPVSEHLAIAIVGTREHSEYGKRAALSLAGELAAHQVVVVSGLARGIDTFSHQAALDAGGVTVGVLGCGLDVDYPKGSAALKTRMCQRGAVISEYPLGTRPNPGNFPLRNRILSGMSSGVVVVEADEKSGSIITATHALEQGREVFAVPGDIFHSQHTGTNRLIQDGAKLVRDAGDVLEEFGVPYRKKTSPPVHKPQVEPTTIVNTAQDTVQADGPPPTALLPDTAPGQAALPEGLSPQAAELLGHITRQPVNIESLALSSGLDISNLQTALTELEIYGLILGYPGRMFCLN